MENTENTKQQPDRDNKNLALISIGVVIIVVGLWLWTLYILKDKTHEDRGTYGDMFGGINALFSGLAFGGIIITILLQRKDLALQQEELRETRKELERTTKAQIDQNNTLLSQQYQTTFFNLLSNHSALINSIHFRSGQPIGYEGLAAFNSLVISDTKTYSNAIKGTHFLNSSETMRNPMYLLEEIPHFFDSLFGDLETIIRIIDGLLRDDLYHDILFNHLTTSEKFLIGLYCDCISDTRSRMIALHHYRYEKYYQSRMYTYRLSPETYFPAISIERNKSKSTMPRSEVTRDGSVFDFKITIVRDQLGGTLTLKAVHLSAFDSSTYNQLVPIFDQEINDASDGGISLFKGTNVHLMPYVYDKLFSNFRPLMVLQFNFLFSYHEIEYWVTYRVDIITNESSKAGGEVHLSFSVDQ